MHIHSLTLAQILLQQPIRWDTDTSDSDLQLLTHVLRYESRNHRSNSSHQHCTHLSLSVSLFLLQLLLISLLSTSLLKSNRRRPHGASQPITSALLYGLGREHTHRKSTQRSERDHPAHEGCGADASFALLQV